MCVWRVPQSAGEYLARISHNLHVECRKVYHDELIESESHLALLGAKLCSAGYPYRTPNQIHLELIRIRVRFDKKVEKGKFMTQWDLDSYPESYRWVDESDDSDDFMPSSKPLK